MIASRSRRGSLLYGLSAILVITAFLSAATLARSLDIYRRSVDLEARLRVTAALEGAGAVLSPSPGSAPDIITLPGTRVSFAIPTVEKDRLRLPASAEVLAANGSVAYTKGSVLEFARMADGTWKFRGIVP